MLVPSPRVSAVTVLGGILASFIALRPPVAGAASFTTFESGQGRPPAMSPDRSPPSPLPPLHPAAGSGPRRGRAPAAGLGPGWVRAGGRCPAPRRRGLGGAPLARLGQPRRRRGHPAARRPHPAGG